MGDALQVPDEVKIERGGADNGGLGGREILKHDQLARHHGEIRRVARMDETEMAPGTMMQI